MLDKEIKDVIGKEVFYVDANKLEVGSGIVTGLVLSEIGFLLVYIKTEEEKKSCDYKNVHATREEAEAWLKQIAPAIVEANRLVAECNEAVNKIRTEQIVGEPYLVV